MPFFWHTLLPGYPIERSTKHDWISRRNDQILPSTDILYPVSYGNSYCTILYVELLACLSGWDWWLPRARCVNSQSSSLVSKVGATYSYCTTLCYVKKTMAKKRRKKGRDGVSIGRRSTIAKGALSSFPLSLSLTVQFGGRKTAFVLKGRNWEGGVRRRRRKKVHFWRKWRRDGTGAIISAGKEGRRGTLRRKGPFSYLSICPPIPYVLYDLSECVSVCVDTSDNAFRRKTEQVAFVRSYSLCRANGSFCGRWWSMSLDHSFAAWKQASTDRFRSLTALVMEKWGVGIKYTREGGGQIDKNLWIMDAIGKGSPFGTILCRVEEEEGTFHSHQVTGHVDPTGLLPLSLSFFLLSC